MASLSSIVKCLWARPGAYPRVEYLKGASLGYAPGLTHKHKTRLDRLAKDKHSNLLGNSINYDR